SFAGYMALPWGIQIRQLDINILPHAFSLRLPFILFVRALKAVKSVSKVTISGLEDETKVKLMKEAALGNGRVIKTSPEGSSGRERPDILALEKKGLTRG
ncbi:MAG: hypothetical protein M1830_000940, partial [Pleopsidium flavum]